MTLASHYLVFYSELKQSPASARHWIQKSTIKITYNPSENVNIKNKYIEGESEISEFKIYTQVGSLILGVFTNEPI